MKKCILFFFALIVAANGFGQLMSITGTVTQLNSTNPVPNHAVVLYTDSVPGATSYSATTMTDVNGHYSFSFNVALPQTVLHVRTLDCQNYAHVVNLVTSSAPLVANFQICYNSIPGCTVSFHSTPDSAGFVHFTPVLQNASTNYVVQWSFGDGSSGTNFDPTHHYPTSGMYTACLTVTDTVHGCTASFCDSVIIASANNCVSSFTYSLSPGTTSVVNFTYTGVAAVGTQYYWNFGDGTTSTDMNPIHHFTSSPLTYNVCLTIVQGNCNNTHCEVVTLSNPTPCNVSFHWVLDSVNSAPFSYHFLPILNSASSSAIVTWSFSNGTTLTAHDPHYSFPGPGAYYICMYYNDPTINCQTSVCDTLIIDSANVPSCFAAFTYTITGNSVHFNFAGSLFSNNQYAWSFGDSTTSVDQNPTHIFAATGGGVYTVCLTMIHSGCLDTHCEVIHVGNIQNAYQISGNVHLSSGIPADIGTVTLYCINPASTPFVVTQTTNIIHDSLGNALYVFPNLGDGYYLTQAHLSPASNYFQSTLPTYHLHSFSWNNANIIHINGNSMAANIEMLPSTNAGGNGSINGNVLSGGFKTAGDAVSGIEILVLDINGNPVSYATSENSGSFHINNLAMGTYQVMAEIAGISCTPYFITLDANQPVASGVNVTVNTNSAIISQVQDISDLNLSGQVFPNPSTDQAQIGLNGMGRIFISIFDQKGALILSETREIYGKQLVNLNTHTLYSGIYTLCIENESQQKIYRKLIISK